MTMKSYIKSSILLFFVIGSHVLFAQNVFSEQVVVPLSSPGERGRLEVNQINGSISVEGYDGKEVIINAVTSKKEEDRKGKNPPPGMKRIASNPVELRATEDHNEVNVNTESWKRRMDLTIKVPTNFDLQLHVVHGEIEVSNIEGEMEISGVNGGIELDQISGSVVCNTVNGEVNARFVEITDGVPMSFVTLNGNVDVTLPAKAKVLTKMRSERGEIYSDFDMDMTTSKPKITRGEDCDCEYEVSINSWVYGTINGGTSEFTFKNMNGDILIRKGK